MPSIEIVCVGQIEPLDFSNYSFAVKSSHKLVSQRSPKPLFQPEFDAATGCIYYLGSPLRRDLTAQNYLAAGDLLIGGDEFSRWERIFFALPFVADLHQLLAILIEASPVKQLLFTSDYQFGPDAKRPKRALNLARFWKLHDEHRLQMNALYQLRS